MQERNFDRLELQSFLRKTVISAALNIRHNKMFVATTIMKIYHIYMLWKLRYVFQANYHLKISYNFQYNRAILTSSSL